MEIRRANLSDVDGIMKIIAEAQKYLKLQRIDQWQDGFPSREVIENDINNAEAYVICDNDTVAAYYAFYHAPEPVYADIHCGAWGDDDGKYGVIHRMAVSEAYRGQGLSHKLYEHAIGRCLELGYNSIRVDTHAQNVIMRSLAATHGFEYCGIVYYPGGLERIAYERMLTPTAL